MSDSASIKDVMAYFDMGVSEFSKEWKQLSADDKSQLKSGIGDGSLTY